MRSARNGYFSITTLCLLSQVSALYHSNLQTNLISCDEHLTSILSFSKRWRSLGPFRLGTREAPWGADPLEALGGFPQLRYDSEAFFRSPLAPNATVGWTQEAYETVHESPTSVALQLSLAYPHIDWQSQQRTYGWSALQYQAWTRGYILNQSPCTRKVLLRPHGILEFHFNGQHFFGGDFYGSDRAPIIIELLPGGNRLDVRLFYDVRSMGGNIPPTIDAKIQCELVSGEIKIDEALIKAPDLVNGRLPSGYFSVPVTNLHHDTVIISNCDSADTHDVLVVVSTDPIRIAPGQTRPVAYRLVDRQMTNRIRIAVCYYMESDKHQTNTRKSTLPYSLGVRSIREAHKLTFLHPGGVVSYTMLKPPHYGLNASTSRPLLLNLHGAGVEADGDMVRHSLDDVKDLEAFALFPTGMTAWSSDDWHIWGHADVLSAINAVHDWVRIMDWQGTAVSTDKVLVVGHSNGGQGTWFFATHLPDRTLAAAALSGYTSIENYVPYNFWAETDSLKQAITGMARASFKHELLLENVADVPILQQHGSADDNVPPYHSRLMCSLRAILGNDSTYIEFPKKGHWWDGAMTTQPLQEFYFKHLSNPTPQRIPLQHFSIVSLATDEMGAKNGILIQQLRTPNHYGRLNVRVEAGERHIWYMESSNIRRLQFQMSDAIGVPPQTLKIDQSHFNVDDASQVYCFLQDLDGLWHLQDCSMPDSERTGRQRGSLDAILRTQKHFQIVAKDSETSLAVQVSRNLLQYFGADSSIHSWRERSKVLDTGGNVISLSTSRELNLSTPAVEAFPVTFGHHGIRLCPQRASCRTLPYDTIMGAIFIQPLNDERLEALVWGADASGLQAASRLLPTLTGVGQPDFIVLGPASRWQGLQGALAVGFFDYSWNISQVSYVSW